MFLERLTCAEWSGHVPEMLGDGRTELCLWSRCRSRTLLDPEHRRIGFYIYSRSSGKWGVIEGVEVKGYVTRSVFGEEVEFIGFHVEDGLGGAREVGEKPLENLSVLRQEMRAVGPDPITGAGERRVDSKDM